jgi:integrase
VANDSSAAVYVLASLTFAQRLKITRALPDFTYSLIGIALATRRQRHQARPSPALGQAIPPFAPVLLSARLGLRACEVIRSRIDDIDRSHGCWWLVRAGKNHRERKAASLPASR